MKTSIEYKNILKRIAQLEEKEKLIHAILYLLPEETREYVYKEINKANEMHELMYGRKVVALIELDIDEFSESDIQCLDL